MEKSIVQIFGDFTEKSYVSPWSRSKIVRGTGTGFCVELDGFNTPKGVKQKFILTNAHCVDGTTHINIRKSNSSKMWLGKIEAVAFECDLALLSVKTSDHEKFPNSKPKTNQKTKSKKPNSQKPNTKTNQKTKPNMDDFWNDLPAVEFAHMPEKLSRAYVYGYPFGGYNVSITKGVVNRISIVPYYMSTRVIAIQIDAPINFGNSGGPAFNDEGKVIGVAFSGEDDTISQNMGYIIPSLIVEYFFRRIQNEKTFYGICDLGICAQNLSNQTLREYHDLKPQHTGILINGTMRIGAASGILETNDILMKIGDVNIDNDGTISLKELLSHYAFSKDENEYLKTFKMEERIPYNNLISLMLPNDKVELTILRKGVKKNVTVTTKIRPFLVPILSYQLEPSYYIIGGLIFVPLSYMFIDEKIATGEYVYNLIEIADGSIMEDIDEQIIVLSSILNTDLTEDYKTSNYVLSSINGKKPVNLKHLKKLVDSEKGKFLKFDFKDSAESIIINNEDAKKYTKEIIKDKLNITEDFCC